MRLSRSLTRGHALLFLLLLTAAVGVTLFVYGASTEVTRAINADAKTRAVLEQARAALIARAVSDANRPGSLPCPDAVTSTPNNVPDDGIADLLVGNACPSYIGRLPWRTLGVGDLRDAHGERLWYALSPNFRDDNSVQINSDSKGTLTVYAGSSANAVTRHGAADARHGHGSLQHERFHVQSATQSLRHELP